jgi:hypothetical protein
MFQTSAIIIGFVLIFVLISGANRAVAPRR